MIIALHAKVRTGHNTANLIEIEALQSNRSHLFLVVHKVELIKTFPLVINLNPSVMGYISENFILGLQAKLISKFTA